MMRSRVQYQYQLWLYCSLLSSECIVTKNNHHFSTRNESFSCHDSSDFLLKCLVPSSSCLVAPLLTRQEIGSSSSRCYHCRSYFSCLCGLKKRYSEMPHFKMEFFCLGAESRNFVIIFNSLSLSIFQRQKLLLHMKVVYAASMSSACPLFLKRIHLLQPIYLCKADLSHSY